MWGNISEILDDQKNLLGKFIQNWVESIILGLFFLENSDHRATDRQCAQMSPLSQVFRQNLKPRLDKFSLYCFQIGIDHSFFYHSSSAIAIFHTTFQELFNRVIYFWLLKQKYAAICAQTWNIEKKLSIFLCFNRISQLFTNRFG